MSDVCRRKVTPCTETSHSHSKVMYNAAAHAEFIHDHAGYGFDVDVRGFDWKRLKEKRDAYVLRLNGGLAWYHWV